VVEATASAHNPYPRSGRRYCRRVTPAALGRVDGRLVSAWALSTPSETPPCSDQLNDSSATHANVEVAIAVLVKAAFMDFLHRFTAHIETVRPRST
jgi:hypothetical protein